MKSKQEQIPLSFAQQRLWFLDQLLPVQCLYNIPFALHVIGKLNVEALSVAIKDLITRHAILRTKIDKDDFNEPYQIICSPNFMLNVIDLSSHPKTVQNEMIQEYIKQESFISFDLKNGPLIRAKLLQLERTDENILLITFHHITFDEWSMSIFLQELGEIYNAYIEKRPGVLSPLPFQYADFAYWQKELLKKSFLKDQLSFWKKQLADLPELLLLPTDNVRPRESSYVGNCHKFKVSSKVLKEIKNLAEECQVTVFMVLLAAFQVLLYRYSNQEDIIVGSPIANRHYPEVDGLIGFFVNTLALRTICRGELRFKELLQCVKETTLKAYENQDTPFEQLVEVLEIDRRLDRHPIFQVMFALQSPEEKIVNLKGIEGQFIDTGVWYSQFDLTLVAQEKVDGLGLQFEYATDLFNNTSIERMAIHLSNLLENLYKYADCSISTLPFLTDNEYRQIIYEWNNTKKGYPTFKCLHQLFEEQVKRTPHQVAVVFENNQLTYQELNARANQLAHHLRKQGVGRESIVAISVERSLELIVGLLGILKAGGAYVPLDPYHPTERLNFILKDTNASFLLTQSKLRKKFISYNQHIIQLDVDCDVIEKESELNPSHINASSDLVYIIYTSGSTGKPKGVMINHAGVVNLVLCLCDEFNILANDRFISITTYAFDIAGFEIFGPLINGAQLLIASEQIIKNGYSLAELIDNANITTVQATPTTWELLLKAGWKGKQNLKIICGGEVLPRILFEKLIQLSEYLWNVYGPTETTIWSTFKRLNMCDKSNLIGKPIANTDVYILSKNKQVVPIGVIGELYIGGIGVARGYLNLPELTSRQFIEHPFKNDSNTFLYRTGDLCRYLADGNIEYIGRIDEQVKIRGYRIELAEIESLMSEEPAVKQAMVIVKGEETDHKYLVGYAVVEADDYSKEKQEEIIQRLYKRLLQNLPEYMVPNGFVLLKELPLTSNGKVDKKALPLPNLQKRISTRRYLAPKTDIEKQLAAVWQTVLMLEAIGIEDNFFEIGGNSFLVLKLYEVLKKEISNFFTVTDLFRYPTISQFSNYLMGGIMKKDKNSMHRIEKSRNAIIKARSNRIKGYE